ncbi:MAG: thiamine diphosphokinase [Clostridiales bacterium]|nr:thiamine diphosphokinase [Clostridiales bacterium]
MSKDICYIFCGGEQLNMPMSIPDNCYVIAVDFGLKYLEQNNIKPDLIVGDFDSLGYIPQYKNVITLSKDKDDTDTMFAIKEGMKLGFKEFHIFCGTGGQFQHTFANIQCLAFIAEKNLKGILYDGNSKFSAIHNTSLKIVGGYGNISVFSLSNECKGVFLKGLKYPLENYTMTNTYPIGINNEFIGKEVEIIVECGTLLIIIPFSVKV